MFNIQNWIIMSLKFFPLIFAIIIGYIYLGIQGAPHPIDVVTSQTPLLDNLSPICGVIASIPAIFFAFNGFQYPASLTSSMKKPKKIPTVMIIGLIIVTVIYIGISVSIMLCTGDGKISGLEGWLKDHGVAWIYAMINILIGVGILSVINGTVVTGVNIYHDLIKNKELIFTNKMGRFYRGGNSDNHLGAVLYGFILSAIFFALCTLIGCFFSNTSNIGEN
jgi:amino acid transporter